LVRFEADFSGWIEGRQSGDGLGRYRSQLGSLGEVIGEGIGRLESDLEAAGLEGDLGEVYRKCRQVDRGLVLLQRVSAYFREKFDQRSDPALGPVVAAADEVVWSCFAGAFRSQGLATPPAPLPYVAPLETPSAVPRIEPPAEFRNDHPSLHDWLERLPIPVVGLPPSCVREPWRLVYLGHEVGHHVQLDLEPGWSIEKSFGERLEGAVPEEAGGRWRSWGAEIFADAYSVAMMGTWAIWAIAELERDGRAGMLAPKSGASGYPCPAVRLALMAGLADSLGLTGTQSLRDWGIDPGKIVADAIEAGDEAERGLAQRAEADLALVGSVIPALRSELSDRVKGIESISAWAVTSPAFVPGGKVDGWARQWAERKPMKVERQLPGARLLCASATAAWARAASGPDPVPLERVEVNLRSHFSEMVAAAREDGDRAEEQVARVGVEGLGAELVGLAGLGGPVRAAGES
jgi:hypothetical protein